MRKFLIFLSVLIFIPAALLAILNLWFYSFKVSDPKLAADIQAQAVLRVRARDIKAADAETNGLARHTKMFYARKGSSPQADLDLALPFRAFDDFSPQMADQKVDFKNLIAHPTPKFTTALETYEANLPALAEILSKPQALYLSEWDKGAEALVPNFILARAMVFNLDGYVRYLMARERYRDAARWALLNQAWGPKWAENGGLLSGMIGIALQSLAYNTSARLIGSGKLTPAELAQFSQVARESLLTPELWLARCDEEFAFELNCIEQTGANPSSLGIGSSPASSLVFKLAPGWLERERRILQELYLRDRPYLEKLENFPPNHAADHGAFIDRNHSYLAAVLYPNYERGQHQIRLALNRDRALQILVALELYRRQHKSYPERLEQLVPSQLSELPRDSLAPDGLFLYSREGKSFTLKTNYTGPMSAPEALRLYPPPDEK